MNNFEIAQNLSLNKKAIAHLNNDFSYIMDFVISGQISEKQFFKEEEKGSFDSNELVKALNKSIKVSDRVKHTFKTLDELNAFEKENECGDMWDENGVWCIYAY